MIPKIIHWCWLSGEPVPTTLQKHMKSWHQIMPEYTIKCWTIENFDIKSVPWVREAVAQKRWAYAADYIRIYALYHEGGIYLDSDVKVLRSFNQFLSYDFFTSIEVHRDFYTLGYKELDSQKRPINQTKPITGLGLQAAIMGGKSCNYLKDCLTWYETHHFVNPDGSLNLITMPGILALIAVKYGFRYEDKDQTLTDGEMNYRIFDSSVFAGSEWQSNNKINYAIHFCQGSWRDKSFKHILKNLLKKIIPSFLRKTITSYTKHQ